MNNLPNLVVLGSMALVLHGCISPVQIAPLPYAHPANPEAPGGILPPLGTGLQSPVRTSGDTLPEITGHEGHMVDDPQASGQYQCPMHPEVRSDEPRRCPVCGMKLVAVEERPEQQSGRHEGHHAQ